LTPIVNFLGFFLEAYFCVNMEKETSNPIDKKTEEEKEEERKEQEWILDHLNHDD